MSKRVSFSKDIETRTIDEIDRQSEESRSDEESRQFNKFRFLNLVDGAESVEKDDELNTDEAIHSDGSSGSDIRDVNKQNGSRQNSRKSSKKSRKRRNKKSAKGRNNGEVAYVEQEFDIDLVNGSDETQSTYSEYNRHLKFLKLDTRSLLPENELKRMFGKGVLREDRRNQAHGGQRSKFVNLRFVDTRQLSSFVGPKMELDDFLNEIERINQGDVMDRRVDKAKSKKETQSSRNKSIDALFNSNHPVYFRFVHDRDYQDAQKEFVQAVHMAQPEAIVHNLSIYPNHAESLLQLSHIIRLSEDYKQASEMIERALLTFERGFHTRFNMATAQCRLSYRRPENRTFFITIFEQITSCHRRGLRKTPLEYSKLLLSLEPENDPLMATQLLDFFALRSEEYDFLIDFYNCWYKVQCLPNMNLSLAMAYFLKSKMTKQTKADCDKLLQQADDQLQKSLLMFPNFILPLLEACGGEPSEELKKCTYFDFSPYSSKYKTVPETLEVLIELYVKRSFGLWKRKQTLSWLEKNVATLVNKFASGELKDDNKTTGHHWANFMKPAPKNLLRHIALCDLKIKMPPSASVATFLAVDPFPPTDAIITYHTSLHQPASASQATNVAASSLPGLFLRSFLPSFSMTSNSSSAQSNGPTQQSTTSSTSGAQTNVDEEIALGEFLANELDAGEQRSLFSEAEAAEFRTSVLNIARSMTDITTQTIRALQGRATGGSNEPRPGGGSSTNQAARPRGEEADDETSSPGRQEGEGRN